MTTSPPMQFPDGPPLPEMREALLSRDDVLALVADLQAHTRVISTLCKAGPQQQTPPGSTPLETAIERLFERTVSAIQIRYAYDGHEWTDTLLNTPTGIRMVRCQHAPV
ncbi:MAG: hypothetical protein DWH91_01520 [Planctomycetota bacterium]|nr:MAG: hypothetical protein DWH91_01520 [Planctomycetota bacterium]